MKQIFIDLPSVALSRKNTKYSKKINMHPRKIEMFNLYLFNSGKSIVPKIMKLYQ